MNRWMEGIEGRRKEQEEMKGNKEGSIFVICGWVDIRKEERKERKEEKKFLVYVFELKERI